MRTDGGRPVLNSIIEMNPDVLSIADELDKESKAGKPRGPLHGIPVLIKDNIDTADHMMTTAGSLALVGAKAPKDSFVGARLRDAGAVILGKTNLSEWANFRSTHSDQRLERTRRPDAKSLRARSQSVRFQFGLRRGDFRELRRRRRSARKPTARSSVRRPSNGLVGIKPTVGLISRAGIIPISHYPGHRRPDGADRARRCNPSWRAGRRRSRRRRYRRQRGQGASRLHAILRSGRTERRAHRCSPKIFRIQRCRRRAHGTVARRDAQAGRHARSTRPTSQPSASSTTPSSKSCCTN